MANCGCGGNNNDFFHCEVEVPCFGVTDPDEFPTLGTGDLSEVWSQITREETFTLPCGLPDIKQITGVTTTPKILKTKVVRTPPRTPVGKNSVGGQRITGYKLCVEGVLCQKITYCTDCGQQYCVDFFRPFSDYIVLPITINGQDPFDIQACLTVVPYVECCFAQRIGPRTIFKNVVLFLHVCV
ncbi:MAG: hypothetical protein PHC60_09685 [Heliobacteriaceae bacterium]|nr:hypothetical protein [Heliobacteriaceae bacterium]